jgi:hypothetical protein
MELILFLIGLLGGGANSGDTPGGPIVTNPPITMHLADDATARGRSTVTDSRD